MMNTVNVIIKILIILIGKFILVNSGGGSGPVGPIKIYSLGECDPSINKINMVLELQTDSGDNKSLKTKFNLLEDYGDDVEVTVVADKWENNEWQKDAFSVDVEQHIKFFDFINKHLSKIWDNFRNAVAPNIENENSIPAGEYELEPFQDTWENVNIDNMMYGRFMVRVTLSVHEDEFVCVLAEGETFEPEM